MTIVLPMMIRTYLAFDQPDRSVASTDISWEVYITLAEFENFRQSVELMKQLREIPLEIIEYYLQNERGGTGSV